MTRYFGSSPNTVTNRKNQPELCSSPPTRDFDMTSIMGMGLWDCVDRMGWTLVSDATPSPPNQDFRESYWVWHVRHPSCYEELGRGVDPCPAVVPWLTPCYVVRDVLYPRAVRLILPLLSYDQ